MMSSSMNEDTCHYLCSQYNCAKIHGNYVFISDLLGCFHYLDIRREKKKKRDCKVKEKDCRLCVKQVSVQMDVTTALQPQECLQSNHPLR